jgi:hypothetical protein
MHENKEAEEAELRILRLVMFQKASVSNLHPPLNTKAVAEPELCSVS